ncbi:MAG: hypothetical protein JW932_15190 [Deltaproteobacteria bacterium]|nr:hypothetical protein [Deltaproteobacteria bacterium]
MSLIIICMIISGAIVAYQFRDQIRIERFFYNKQEGAKLSGIYVRVIVTASINDKTLRLRFLLPCQDIQQRDSLLGKLPVIQHEMIMTLSRPEMVRIIEERRFRAMKKLILETVNNYSERSIQKLYLENWFYN